MNGENSAMQNLPPTLGFSQNMAAILLHSPRQMPPRWGLGKKVAKSGAELSVLC